MDNESEVAYVRAVMENLPTLAIARKAEAGPKGNGSSAWFAIRNQAALDKEPGVKHRPKVAKWMHGTVEPADGSRPPLSPLVGGKKGVSRRPGRMPRRGGWLRKPMPHCNDEDTLT